MGYPVLTLLETSFEGPSRTRLTAVRHPPLPTMAVIDQDSFSSISWHSDQNIRVGSSASAGHEGAHGEEGAGSKSQQGDAVDRVGPPHLDPSHGGDEILECTVTDPHTENAGTKDAYVSYLITTHVSPRPINPPPPSRLLLISDRWAAR